MYSDLSGLIGVLSGGHCNMCGRVVAVLALRGLGVGWCVRTVADRDVRLSALVEEMEVVVDDRLNHHVVVRVVSGESPIDDQFVGGVVAFERG